MSTRDFHTRAARFFLLAEQASRFGEMSRRMLWKMSASLTEKTVVHLPAMAAAVRKEDDNDVLQALAFHPLPGVLPPEAVPWHTRLVEAWKVPSTVWHQDLARPALVRLDGCGMPDGMERPSRLPEWLAEARRIVRAGYEPARTGEWQMERLKMEKLKALAGLAAWRPARGVITPPETLQEWVAFWRERRQETDPLMKGIAAKALLNLPEADLRAASLRPVPPEQLLHDLAAAIPALAERTFLAVDATCFLLLDWQPGENSPLPAAGVAQVARVWLEVALHNAWWSRQMAWQQLIRWDRAGSLATCGIDLLPRLVSATQTEEYSWLLWEMAQWRPAAEAFTGADKPDGLNLLRQLETVWQRHRQSGEWWDRRSSCSAWLVGIRLHRAGLATESPESFLEAYLAAVAQEDDEDVLLILAQWSPDAEAPATFHREWRQGWQSRLGAKDEGIRHVAAFALLHQALEKGEGGQLRRLALEMWRAGTEGATEAAHPFISVASRFQEVRAHLAAGSVPDFGEKPVPPAQRQYPRLALPPGHITGREWKMENGELKMESDGPELKPGNRPAPDGLSR